MHLSILTPASGRERAAVLERARDDAYGDHQWLWRLFPSPPGTPRDFLFRRDEVHGLPRFYIVSAREPHVPGPAWHVQTRAYQPSLAAGDRLAFDLRVSPTVRHQRTGRSQRHDVVMEAKKKLLSQQGLARWAEMSAERRPALYSVVQEATLAWLAKRGRDRAGFDLDEASCTVGCYQQLCRTAPGGRSMTFSSVDVTGELVVRDSDEFTRVLMTGIGSAKAFGCGLLLVRRPL